MLVLLAKDCLLRRVDESVEQGEDCKNPTCVVFHETKLQYNNVWHWNSTINGTETGNSSNATLTQNRAHICEEMEE
jgi:hypothetical protein